MEEDWQKVGMTELEKKVVGMTELEKKVLGMTEQTDRMTEHRPNTPEEEMSAEAPQSSAALASSNSRFVLTLWWGVLLALVAATAATRLHDLRGSGVIAWDEAHFGKFASWYINRTHYFDVHPPLGKLLIAGFGKLSNYDGGFNFTFPGVSFEEYPEVVGMRLGCAVLGAFTLPIGFLTVWEMTSSLSAATLAGMLLLFDTGFACITRYILLDPIMIFFISASFYSMVRFRKLARESFSRQWWRWLAILGLSLAGTISIKFVGLFVVLYVGAFTALDLWNIFGDISRGFGSVVKHLMARVGCLILLPFVVYFSIFCLHLWVMARSGPGDGFFSSLYQATIPGSDMYGAVTPAVTTYGSRISLRASHNMPCGFLHSHQDLYPAGGQNNHSHRHHVHHH